MTYSSIPFCKVIPILNALFITRTTLWLHFLTYNVNGRNMLHGPWKEANAPIVTLQVDDKNVNGEAIAMALAYLYGHHPKLNDNNAFRVLAAASFLDLQVLCYLQCELHLLYSL
jgi:hypothetical protein